MGILLNKWGASLDEDFAFLLLRHTEPTAHCWCTACQDSSVLMEKILKRALPSLPVLVSYFCGTLKTRGALNEVAKRRHGINIRGVPVTMLATDKASPFSFFYKIGDNLEIDWCAVLHHMLCYVEQYAMQILLQNIQQWLWAKISQQK